MSHFIATLIYKVINLETQRTFHETKIAIFSLQSENWAKSAKIELDSFLMKQAREVRRQLEDLGQMEAKQGLTPITHKEGMRIELVSMTVLPQAFRNLNADL